MILNLAMYILLTPLPIASTLMSMPNFLYNKRQRRGVTATESKKLLHDRNYYGACMVQFGEADALISGLTKDYVTTIKPALQIIGTEGWRKPCSRYVYDDY